MYNTTIVAISTPLGPGGIGVIRISGNDSLKILSTIFVRKKHPSDKLERILPSEIKSHRMSYGFIIDPQSGEIIDEVLAIYMRAPKSFTREDVVEIHSHSGYIVLNRILSTISDQGAELAAPGEFTKRAFLNGRIDLSQAEGIIDIINAPSEKAASIASKQVSGGIRQISAQMIEELSGLRSIVEADIEFFEINSTKNIHLEITGKLIPALETLIQRQMENEIFKEGRTIAIIGSPNVGKSSLLNRLVERETAIVSDIPGTTRDLVKDYLSINGVPIELCDTAGIHSTEDPIETIGIERAKNQIDRADIVLLVIQAIGPLSDSDKKMIATVPKEKLVVVLNKEDLATGDRNIPIEKGLPHCRFARVSAKTGFGIDTLKEIIFNEMLINPSIDESQVTIPNLRQRKLLEQALAALNNSIHAIDCQSPSEIISEALKDAQHHLEAISGRLGDEALYDKIFEQFCVGK